MSEHSNNEGPYNNQNLHSQNADQSRNAADPSSQQQGQHQEQAASYQYNQQQQPAYTNSNNYNTQQRPANEYGSYGQQGIGNGQHSQYQYGAQQQSQYQQAASHQGQYGQYPPPPPGGYGYQQPIYPPRKTNTKSIVGLILGIASILIPYIGFFIGIAGIIVNSLSLKEIKRTYEEGKGLAIGGLVTSIIGTALYLIIFLFLVVAVSLFAEANYYY